MKIGESIGKISEEIEEFNRIANLVESKDYVKTFLRNHGNDVLLKMLNACRDSSIKKYNNKKRADREYGEFLQGLKINTYTDPKKINGLLIHFKELVSNSQNKGIRAFSVDFYKMTLREYLIKDYPNLQKLLLTVEIEEREYSTIEYLEIVLNNRKQYNVSVESIKVFYELYWFKRLSDEEHLKISKKMDENTILDSQTKNNALSKKESVKKRDDVESKKNEMLEKRELKRDQALIKRLDRLETEANKMEIFFKSNEKNLEENKKIDISFEHRISKLEKQLSKLENNFDLTIKKIQEDYHDSKKTMIKDFELKNEEQKNFIFKKYDEALANIDSRIIESIEQSKRELLKINLDTALLPLKGDKVQNIKNEVTFIKFWINYLSDNYEIALSVEEAIIYHSIFKTLSYIVSDKFNIIRSWIESLGFEEDVRIESASPLWMNRLDWLGLSSHLEGSKRNKLGVISNYNIAIAEAYLIPQLTRWKLSTISSTHKLFLISSIDEKDRLENKEIFTLAGVVPREDLFKFKTNKNLTNNEQFSMSKGMPKVSLDSYVKWILPRSKDSLRREVVDLVQDKFQIKTPEALYENFMSLLSNLEIYFDYLEAVEISLDATLKPYVESYYGGEKYIQLKGYVLGILENE